MTNQCTALCLLFAPMLLMLVQSYNIGDGRYFFPIPYSEFPWLMYLPQPGFDRFAGRLGMMNPFQELMKNKKNQMMTKICSECPKMPTPTGDQITDKDLVKLLCGGLQYSENNFIYCEINKTPICLVRPSTDATYPAGRGACSNLSTDKAHYTLLKRETLGKIQDFETTCKKPLIEAYVENGVKENRNTDCRRINTTPFEDIDVPCNSYQNVFCEVIFYNF